VPERLRTRWTFSRLPESRSSLLRDQVAVEAKAISLIEFLRVAKLGTPHAQTAQPPSQILSSPHFPDFPANSMNRIGK